MKRTLLALLLTVFTVNIYAVEPSSEKSFCEDRKDPAYMQKLVSSSKNTLGFTNRGGLFGGGVCWWHSRMTRNAAYLAYFSPEKEKLNTEEGVKKILKALRKGKGPVEIPGHKNFNEFSRYNQSIVQDYLDHWQRESGILNQSWIKGVTGKAKRKAKKMQKEMDKTFRDIQEGKVVYHKLQIKGIVAHAWLVHSMEKTDNGYKLNVIDSNYYQSSSYHYEIGDRYLYHRHYGKFSPYREKKREERHLREAIQEHCEEKKVVTSLE